MIRCLRTSRARQFLGSLAQELIFILRLGYLAGSRGQLLLKFGGQTLLYHFSRDLKAAFLPLLGSGATVEIDTLPGKLPCIGDVKVGFLLSSGAGPAIPATAVNG